MTRLVAVAALLALSTPALADDQIPGHSVDPATDGLIAGVALAATGGFSLIPIREDRPLWERELVASDDAVHDNFSRRASHVSDALLATSLVAPAIYLTGTVIDDADGDRLILYGQTIAINAMLAQAAKHLVQRPRPYLYNPSAAARAYAREAGTDAYKSFYSGHAALSFGAAITGAYLVGASEDRGAARVVAWGAGLLVASTTASLRVRAGKHFYSDVVIGAVIGSAVGYLVPALHADEDAYAPTGPEVLAAATGLLGGVVLARLLPLEKDPAAPGAPRSVLSRLSVSPAPMPDGFGFAIGGAL